MSAVVGPDMSHSFAELLGYHDCGLQAILYLIENTDIDLNSPVVVEIVKLLISKLTRTSAADRSSGTFGLGSGHDPVVHPGPSASQATDFETQESCCMNGHHDDASPRSQGCTRFLGDGSGIECDEDRRTTEQTSPKNRTTCEDSNDDDMHDFGQWLTRLASRHPEIARTLCEVAELIDQADEQ